MGVRKMLRVIGFEGSTVVIYPLGMATVLIFLFFFQLGKLSLRKTYDQFTKDRRTGY
jgi:hypothetical protein